MNLVAVLATGLFAGGVSCAAVQGGLLTGLITRQKAAAAPDQSVTGDLAPVGGFLAGKLVSHTVLGALLGALGSAVELSVTARTWLQIGAGLVIITLGLAQLRVPGFRDIVITPPAAWARLVRARTRSSAAMAPAMLGLATVLIPCGVTLSVEALALASGSPLVGAATMAVFVIGTAPLFAALGYLARKAATAWRGRLSAVTGVAVVAMGLYTLNGGLELAGSPLSASRIARTAGLAQTPADSTAVTTANGTQIVEIIAGLTSYSPSNVQVRSGVPTTLLIHSEGADGCIRSFVIRGEQTILPVDGETRIDLGILEPGRLDYACGMGMFTGTLTIT